MAGLRCRRRWRHRLRCRLWRGRSLAGGRRCRLLLRLLDRRRRRWRRRRRSDCRQWRRDGHRWRRGWGRRRARLVGCLRRGIGDRSRPAAAVVLEHHCDGRRRNCFLHGRWRMARELDEQQQRRGMQQDGRNEPPANPTRVGLGGQSNRRRRGQRRHRVRQIRAHCSWRHSTPIACRDKATEGNRGAGGFTSHAGQGEETFPRPARVLSVSSPNLARAVRGRSGRLLGSAAGFQSHACLFELRPITDFLLRRSYCAMHKIAPAQPIRCPRQSFA